MTKRKTIPSLPADENHNTEVLKHTKNRRPYDDRKIKPGEILVPMLATDERIKLLEANRANICVWKNTGRVYQVMFYPVPKWAKKLAMQQFASELNEFLGFKTIDSIGSLFETGYEPVPSGEESRPDKELS